MKLLQTPLRVAALAVLLTCCQSAMGAVSAEEAARLKSDLTPFGAEIAGNKDGTIPAWTGGYTTPLPGFVNGGKRGDPFAGEKPLYSITARNLAQYADKLSDGQQAMLKKYPDTYRIDVYPTHRTAAAPRWVYDNTFKNATRAKFDNNTLTGAYGGIPFPIPKSGEEIILNHRLRWRGHAWHVFGTGMVLTGEGKQVPALVGDAEFQMPYYDKDGSLETFSGITKTIRMKNLGPPIRAGEAIVGRDSTDVSKNQVWVYLTGQRRTRKLPNACCDMPSPGSAGVMNFDQSEVIDGRTDLFDWKIVGKKELVVPYNDNRQLQYKTKDLILLHHLNPDALRYELHRVWVVEATLKSGQRHVQPRRRFYLDEDSWSALLADHWDANGKLWQTGFSNPIVMPDLPATSSTLNAGFYDLLSGAAFFSSLMNDQAEQYKIVPRYPEANFTPEGLAGDGIR